MSPRNTKTSTLRFNINQQCPITSVTVYNDRAEVTRLLRYHFDAEGTHDLIFEGFSPFVDLSSIHVNGGASRTCTIVDVACQTRFDHELSNDETAPLEKLKIELEKIETAVSIHEREIARLEKQRTWLDGRASKLMNQDGQFNVNDLDAMQEFMDFYHRSLFKLDDRKVIEENEIKRLLQQRNGLKPKFSEYDAKYESNCQMQRHELTITVHVACSNIDFNLEISYLISNCTWNACYDIRVKNSDQWKQTTQFTYYGVVINRSLENWSDVQLSLSTAIPSLGGVPPSLSPLKINYYQPSPRYYELRQRDEKEDDSSSVSAQSSAPASTYLQTKHARTYLAASQEQISISANQILVEDEQDNQNLVNAASSMIKANMLSANFSIAGRATIDGDGIPHRVTIDVLDLTSTFVYTIVPKLSIHVYLKASTVNTSDKQFLAGPVSIFMDNNFITRSSIDNICVGDKFDLPLGTDSSIKVEYKPIQKLTDTHGLISKTYYEIIRCETRIINTKPTDVTIYVYEQVPMSLDEKIKVKLLVPDIRTKELNSNCTVTINDAHILEWKCNVQARGECQLPLEYRLEWPTDRRIEIKET